MLAGDLAMEVNDLSYLLKNYLAIYENQYNNNCFMVHIFVNRSRYDDIELFTISVKLKHWIVLLGISSGIATHIVFYLSCPAITIL